MTERLVEFNFLRLKYKNINFHVSYAQSLRVGKEKGVIIDDARHPPKNATVKNFTSTDFLGPVKFDSPNGGTSNSRIKKNVNSPFKKRDLQMRNNAAGA